jgi:3-keto-5-aminohexanoate cleavage enzyme
MTEVLLRKMTAGDVDAAMRILDVWNMAPVPASAENPDPERSGIDIKNAFVALCGDQIAGVASYIDLSADVAETASLAVDPQFKGKGIGYRLQAARLSEMKKRGFSRVRTETDRPETIEWYIRKFGYRIVGKNPKKHAFSLPDVDCWTVLELELSCFNA